MEICTFIGLNANEFIYTVFDIFAPTIHVYVQSYIFLSSFVCAFKAIRLHCVRIYICIYSIFTKLVRETPCDQMHAHVLCFYWDFDCKQIQATH